MVDRSCVSVLLELMTNPLNPVHSGSWIEKVTDAEIVKTPQEECLEGEHLKFKAHVRGWETETRKERCQQLLEKSDYNLRRALLRPLWKDILLISQA